MTPYARAVEAMRSSIHAGSCRGQQHDGSGLDKWPCRVLAEDALDAARDGQHVFIAGSTSAAQTEVARINTDALAEIVGLLWTKAHIPPGTPPERIIIPYPHEIVTRVRELVTVLADLGLTLGLPGDVRDDLPGLDARVSGLMEHHDADLHAVADVVLGDDAARVDRAALLGAVVGRVADLRASAAAGSIARRNMLASLASRFIPDGDRPANGTTDAAVWDYRVGAARELLAEMGER